jgi:hypothetical protein
LKATPGVHFELDGRSPSVSGSECTVGVVEKDVGLASEPVVPISDVHVEQVVFVDVLYGEICSPINPHQ